MGEVPSPSLSATAESRELAEEEIDEELLLKSRANVDAQDICGERPIHKAVFLGKEENMRVLIAHNADLQAPSHEVMEAEGTRQETVTSQVPPLDEAPVTVCDKAVALQPEPVSVEGQEETE